MQQANHGFMPRLHKGRGSPRSQSVLWLVGRRLQSITDRPTRYPLKMPMASPGSDRQQTRRPLVLIITGPPASGKSSLGHQLAPKLRLPLLSKDLIKETLFDHLGWSDRHWSARLGSASMALLCRSAAALLEVGQSVALEANFYDEWDTPELRKLAEASGCRFFQVVCTASAATLAKRYRHRIAAGERHPGHTESEPLEEVLARLFNGRWEALALEGPVLTVNTERLPSRRMVDDVVRQVQQEMNAEDRPC